MFHLSYNLALIFFFEGEDGYDNRLSSIPYDVFDFGFFVNALFAIRILRICSKFSFVLCGILAARARPECFFSV